MLQRSTAVVIIMEKYWRHLQIDILLYVRYLKANLRSNYLLQSMLRLGIMYSRVSQPEVVFRYYTSFYHSSTSAK